MLVTSGLAIGADPLTVASTNTLPVYTLAQVVDLALIQNPDVRAAQKRIKEATGSIIEARSGYLPSLTGSASAEYLEPDYAQLGGGAPDRRSFIWDVGIRLTQKVYSGGAVSGRLSIARLQHESRLLDYRATIERVLMDSRIAFYEILKNRADVEVHEQAVAFFQRQLESERARLELGTGQRLHVLRAEVNLALEQAALLESGNRLRTAQLRLGELLALPAAQDPARPSFDIEGILGVEPFTATVEECLVQAWARRPELKIRDNDTQVQRHQLAVDRSEWLPQLDVFIGYDVVSEPDRPQPEDFYTGYVAGVAVRWHAFDGWATRGRMQSSRARLDAAQLQQESARRSIEAEVLRAYDSLRRAEETIASQAENVQLATESLQVATANFDQGLTSQLELLQSQLDLTRTRTTELAARFEYNAALARLHRAIGSEFHFEPPLERPQSDDR